nr:hypothetical protein [Candidatus Kapabacteria bacterium]
DGASNILLDICFNDLSYTYNESMYYTPTNILQFDGATEIITQNFVLIQIGLIHHPTDQI